MVAAGDVTRKERVKELSVITMPFVQKKSILIM